MDFYDYKVGLNNIIERPSTKILTYLYQPIIGFEAITIYRTLFEEWLISKDINNFKLKINRLFNITGLNQELYFDSIKKLEAVGLMKTLVNAKKEYYLFTLNSPLEPINFFNSNILNSYLYSKVGKTDYELLRFIFRDDNKINNNSECVDISSSFNDVFDNVIIEDEMLKSTYLKPKPSKDLIVSEKTLIKIKNMLIENCIKFKISNSMFKEWINEIFLLFRINESMFIDLILKFNKNIISEKDKNPLFSFISYELKRKLHSVSNTFFDIKSTIIEKKNIKIKEMETIDAQQYMMALLSTEMLNESQKELIKELSLKYKLRDSVINCLLEFSYLKNEKNIVANYIYKIAKSLNENQIKTAEDAMQYLITAHKNSRVIKPKNQIVENSYQNKPTKDYKINVDNDVKLDLSLWGDL
ncbi:DnaD domain protein [Spiroplasma turonicum]|uniref:Chromosome replication initiation and membrane attachment protein n=1 Tax=Spiroplasma turonicum TaxID=216946 RepID=A0A0K1P692_9MOLU|nr:DnaD domain protein [Spiroplasma turonicum]AKU79412.1 chromosome replication initiation and membrane attachment protein [Spiroplasma turonicum]ALX70433.1 chromosome replication initiation and membrane attachment protein [Spiroplasma turonicum]